MSSHMETFCIECINMNDEDRKYLKSVEKKRPSLEVFKRMVSILAQTQGKTDQLLTIADTSLLETFKTI